MTGRILDRETASFLVLIIPIALLVIVLSQIWTWVIVLTLVALTIAWKLWQKSEWEKWSEKVNPYFNQLIKENQGCLTIMDLSLKANLSGAAAQKFLDRKAEEYGAQRQKVAQGTVYYFLTASALGSIFDDSEPLAEAPPVLEGTKLTTFATPSPDTPTSSPAPEKQAASPEVKTTGAPDVALPLETFTPERKTEETKQPEVAPVSPETPPKEPEIAAPVKTVATEETTTATPNQEKASSFSKVTEEEDTANSALIQSELAKRLETSPSTLAKRKVTPEFTEWSQSRDPDGIGWKYNPKTKLFTPLENPKS